MPVKRGDDAGEDQLRTSISTVVYSRQPLLRSGLKAVLSNEPDIEVAAETGSAKTVRALAAESQPDVILVNEPMTPPTLALVRSLAEDEATRAPVVLLTDVTGDLSSAAAIPGCAVLTRAIDPSQLVAALRLVAAGYLPLDARLVSRFASFLDQLSVGAGQNGDGTSGHECLNSLTNREADVLRLVAFGLSNGEIAQALSVAESTVKTHVRGILNKLDLRDRVQAAVFAYRVGLVAV